MAPLKLLLREELGMSESGQEAYSLRCDQNSSQIPETMESEILMTISPVLLPVCSDESQADSDKGTSQATTDLKA